MSASQWPDGVISRAGRAKGMVALTFDDGPNVPATSQIREILNSYGVRGTFFTVGKALDTEPDVSRALVDDGHVLGNHSYSHRFAGWLSPSYDELATAQDSFARNLDLQPVFFRPPYGLISRPMRQALDERAMTCVTWDVAVEDWSLEDAGEIVRRVLDTTHPGSIVLLHDGHDGDVTGDRMVLVKALPAILDGLRERSLEPVGLDTLIEMKPYLA